MSVQMSQCDRNELKTKCCGKSSKLMESSTRYKDMESVTRTDINSDNITSLAYKENHEVDCHTDVTKLTMIVNQMTHQFNDALDLKNEPSVNGIVNGFGVLHCETESSHTSSLTCKEDSCCHEVTINGCEEKDQQIVQQVKEEKEVGPDLELVPAENSTDSSQIQYVLYESELQMPSIVELIQKDLSEPYSIYTYRYFIHNWPKLCFLAMCDDKCVGAIVCKLDMHKKIVKRGYIAMLAVDEHYRKRKIGSNLVLKAIRAMASDDADEVVLETEITNQPALKLYENLGFVRDKRLFRYYLNGVDALRLKLWLR